MVYLNNSKNQLESYNAKQWKKNIKQNTSFSSTFPESFAVVLLPQFHGIKMQCHSKMQSITKSSNTKYPVDRFYIIIVSTLFVMY